MAAFDPDAYLAKAAPKPAPAAFDPDAYLQSKAPPPPGMRAVKPGEIPTASGFVPEPQPDVPRTFMQRVTGTLAAPLDVALTLGSGVARGVTAPIYGLVSGRGEAGVKEVLAGVRQPQTPEAQAALEFVAPVLQALPPVIGTGTIPQIATAPVTRTAGAVAAATAEDIRRTAISREAARTRQRVAQSQQLGPKVDAAAQGRELGLAAPPQQIDPSKATQTRARVAGEKTIADELNRANATKWDEGAREDLGLAPGTKLDDNALAAARTRPEITSAYDDVANIGALQVDDVLARDLNNVRPGQVYGASKETAAVNAWVDGLQQELSAGADSAAMVRSIRQMRDEANSLFKSEKAGAKVEPVDMAMAQAKLGAADALEELLARNVQDRTVLYRFQDARRKLAQTYDYERALDFATGQIDPQALAKLASAGKPLSGNLEKMANFAANFPEVSTLSGAGLRPSVIARAGRGTVGGAIGSAIGGLVSGGNPLGFAAGAALGGVAGERLSTLTARGMASPSAQAALANVPDYRLPVNRLTPAEISTNRMLPTIYDWQRATAPNWVPGRGGPDVAFGTAPPPNVPLLGLSSAEETMANVQRMRAGEYQSDLLRAQAAERAAQEAAQSPYGQMVNQLAAGQVPLTPRAAPPTQFQRVQVGVDAQGAPIFEVRPVRAPATQFEPGEARFGRGTPEAQTMEFNEATGRFYPAEPTPGGPVAGAPTSLQTAVDKLAGEMSFETKSQYQRVRVGTDAQGAPVYEVRSVPLTLTPAEAEKYALPTRQPQAFKLTADERVAWNKAKADIAILDPGLNKLSDAQVAAKMADRQWVADTIQAARDRLAALGRQEAAQAEALANRNNLRQMGQEIAARKAELEKIRADRASLMNSLEALEEQLRAPRPVELGGQGPKTRAARAEANPGRTNRLAPEEPVVNRLIVPESVGSGPRPQPGPVNVTAGPSMASRQPPAPVTPAAPAAPPTPPTPPTPPAKPAGGADTLTSLFQKVDQGFTPKEANLNDMAWLQRQVERLREDLELYQSRPDLQVPASTQRDLPRLIDALDQRLQTMATSSQQTLEKALNTTFGYTPAQAKRHFSSRDNIERGIFQIQQLIKLADEMAKDNPASRKSQPPNMEQLLEALQARLKEIK
jgi:hypothetical protein